ncbi:hypothetical protein MtrunA17_Chr2g0306341 [Medicago truncatula]|uniref:Transmembrane protein n=1 Tax=Medicago truncatula TaxID=3880 RepID=A0A396J9V0_MEDTR|nr:hypothetical protein MtrunA17_Chr2g0306341 [Medicago truncatula]
MLKISVIFLLFQCTYILMTSISLSLFLSLSQSTKTFITNSFSAFLLLIPISRPSPSCTHS